MTKQHIKGDLHRHGLDIHIKRIASGKVVEHTCIAIMNDTMNFPIVENANHILKCWNEHDKLKAKADSHDALLDALTTLYNDCRNQPMDDQRGKIMDATYKVIAKATK